jgi:hypothetical protein
LKGYRKQYYFFLATASLRALPARNLGTLAAAIFPAGNFKTAEANQGYPVAFLQGATHRNNERPYSLLCRRFGQVGRLRYRLNKFCFGHDTPSFFEIRSFTNTIVIKFPIASAFLKKKYFF